LGGCRGFGCCGVEPGFGSPSSLAEERECGVEHVRFELAGGDL
jgi:hypothetical protein